MSINELIFSFVRDDYQRDNFDAFSKKVYFKYDVPSIHVAGSSGKTVVASILNNVYKAANYRVGLFISSSSKRVEDMVFVNGNSVSSTSVEKIFNDHQKLFKKYDLSHFEIITFIAFTIFKQENVDLAVIECGMGGEIDATNIFEPILSIITNVSMEHTEYLGVSPSEIALHKAGIIKKDIPTVIGEIDGDALDVIVDVARKKNSKITRIGKDHNLKLDDSGIVFDYKTYEGLFIPNISKTNVKNACLVIDAVDLLEEKFPVDEQSLKEGLKQKLPIGRFEYIVGKPSLLFDSAHNPDAIKKLREDVDALLLNKEIFIIFASFNDKNITLMLPEIAILGKLYLTTFEHPRARKEEDYFLYLDEYEFRQDYKALFNELKEANPESLIIFTGSTAFTDLVRKELNRLHYNN